MFNPEDHPTFQPIRRLDSLVPRAGVNQIRGINQAGATGAGIPKQVTNVFVTVANAQTGSTSAVTVVFHRDPSDKNFAGVYVWVRGYQQNPAPVQIASSADSPVTFVLNNTGEAVSLIVQAYGNGGSASLASAPTSGLSLPKSSGGGVGTSTVTGSTVSGTVGALAKISGTSAVSSTNLTGDVTTSNTPACTVVGIQGTSVDSLALLDGDLLRYSVTSGKYEPVMNADWLVLPHVTSSVPDVIYQNYWGSLTFTGGGTASLVASTASEVYGIKYATSTTAGTTAGFGLNGTSNALAFGNYRRLRFKLSLDQTATCRLWFGWGSTTGATFGIWGKDTLTTPFVGFRYSTNAGDTKYQCVTNTGAAQTTVAESTASHVDTNIHVFDIVYDGTQGKFYIDRTLVGTINTNLPATTTVGGPWMVIDNITTAASRTFTFYRAAGTIDYAKVQ